MVLVSKFKNHFDKITLALVLLLLIWTNFLPNTWLIGWDNLLPELNIGLNLKRSFLSVWQQYQGLGLVGGMAHSTELIRQLILLPFTLFLPLNLIRYLWQFAMLGLGIFSLNFGLKKFFHLSKSSSLLASLFYLLNFGTIQYFWVTFEPFATFWGFFPLLFFSLWALIKKPNRQNLIVFSLVNFLAIPSFYVQTIFVVYFLCLLLVLISHFLINFKKVSLKISLSTVLIVLLLNSFWLIPFSYYLKNDLANTTQAYGNLMANQETFDRNQNHGTFSSFLILKNYYFDFPKGDSTLMSSWGSYFANNYNLISAYLASSFIIIGLIFIFYHLKKSAVRLSILLIFTLSAIALLSATPIFYHLNYLIRQLPLINQVFRSPWTKFLVPAVFSFSVLIGLGIETTFNFFKKIKYSPIFSKIIISLLFLICLFKASFPVFQGNFFYPQTIRPIPENYFQLFNFFEEIPQTSRIMNLPQGGFWGWTNYRWGLSGSGFLWYSLPQPILDRAFDVWNLKNEIYYWELMSVLQQKNSQALHNLIDKYLVEYIIFDQSVYFPDEKIYGKLASSQLELLDQIPNLKLIQEFGNIKIYQNLYPTKIYTTTNPNSSLPIARFNPNFKPEYLPPTESVIYPLEHSSIKESQVTKVITDDSLYFRFQNKNSHNFLGFNTPSLKLDQDYLLKIESRNLEGQNLILSVFDNHNRYYYFKNQIPKSTDWQINWFLIPKMENFSFDSGLTLLFDNPSFNQIDSTNDIKNPTLYPYQNNIPLIENYQSPPNNYLDSKSNIFYYKFKLTATTDSYLVLPQSFHSGWTAFYFSGLKPVFLKDHNLVNDWANAWTIPSNLTSDNLKSEIYILFWPQLLQFLGFALLIPTFIWIFKKKN